MVRYLRTESALSASASNPPSYALLVFTRVCRKWRAAAYPTPRLWCNLLLPDAPRPTEWSSLNSFIRRVKLWMGCSKPFPIARLERRGLKTLPKTFKRAYMAALVPHSRRWVDITLGFGGQDLTYLYSLPDDAFPLLKEIRSSCLAWRRLQ